MQFLEMEIRQVAETVWTTMLGIELLPAPGVPPGTDRVVSGSVLLTGAWEGAITIECSADFARHAAATMFGVEPGSASLADTRDAIGELVNMTGGNVKALLPEPCRLSLPNVMEGTDTTTRVPGGEPVTTLAFDCQGSPLVVRLLKKSEDGKHLGGPVSDVPFPHRREFSRVTVHLQAELTADGIHRVGTMENLSLKGGFFRAEGAPAEGLRCKVQMHLAGTEVNVSVVGTVVRSGPAGCAIQFVEIMGIDSLEHLRNVILFNTNDPAQVEREFQDHLGLRRDN